MQRNQTGNKMQRNFLLYCEQSVLYYKGPVCSLEAFKPLWRTDTKYSCSKLFTSVFVYRLFFGLNILPVLCEIINTQVKM